MSGASARLLTPGDDEFPRRLRRTCASPTQLYVLGTLREHARSVAIVGSRAADRRDLERAERLALDAAAAGYLIVSGGALGVDGAAHRGALRAGGATVAVLGSGVDVLYPPRHRGLFSEIVARGGAVVSPFPLGSPPARWHFVRRNAVIAAMADAVVVVAAKASSGSLHTARAAAFLDRLVAAFPDSDGGERLLAAGAALIEGFSDLEAALAGRPRRATAPLVSEKARVLWSALDAEPRTEVDLAHRAGVDLREVTAFLCELELAGLALVLPGGNYVRSALAPAS